MEYTVIILVDNQRIACNRYVDECNIEFFTELEGPDLRNFTAGLELTGTAMHVRRDATGVVVVLAHEEI